MTGPGKQPIWTFNAGFLEKVKVPLLATADLGTYRHLLVVSDPWSSAGRLQGYALRETGKPFSIEEVPYDRTFGARE